MIGSHWFKHGWKLKVISLGLAIGLWYYAVNEESVEITRMIPLQIKIENKNMSLLKVSTEVLRVTFKAPRAMISEVASADIRFRHVMGNEIKQAGEYSFRPDPRELILPSMGLHTVKIEPSIVRVIVDELVTQKLPVKPNFLGEPAFGYKVREDELQLDPNAVMVQGPKGEIEKITAILTRPINLTGRTRSFRVSTALQFPETLSSQSASMVDLYIPIHEVSEEKELTEIPVKMIRPSGALGVAELNPQKISVVIQGPRRILKNLSAEKMHAYADLSGLDYGEHVVNVSWVFPPGVALKEEKRMQVNATIRRKV